MIPASELVQLVRKAISLYNKYKSHEAVAKLVQVSPTTVTIAFSGSFCYSCGVLDYVEEFSHDFRILNDWVELKIDKTRQTSEHSFEADYKVIAR